MVLQDLGIVCVVCFGRGSMCAKGVQLGRLFYQNKLQSLIDATSGERALCPTSLSRLHSQEHLLSCDMPTHVLYSAVHEQCTPAAGSSRRILQALLIRGCPESFFSHQ